MPRGGAQPGAGRPPNKAGPHESVTLWLPPELMRRIDQIAEAADVNRSKAITALLSAQTRGD